MADRGFPKHFDGQRFYNPDAPQARSFLDGLRWKLTSHPEPSPTFIEDVMPSVPPRSVDACQIVLSFRFAWISFYRRIQRRYLMHL
jgi:hypothetical protein